MSNSDVWTRFSAQRTEFKSSQTVWTDILVPKLRAQYSTWRAHNFKIWRKNLVALSGIFAAATLLFVLIGLPLRASAMTALPVTAILGGAWVTLTLASIGDPRRGRQRQVIMQATAEMFGIKAKTDGQRLVNRFSEQKFMGLHVVKNETPSAAMLAFQSVSLMNWTAGFSRGDCLQGAYKGYTFAFEELSFRIDQTDARTDKGYATLSVDWRTPEDVVIVLAAKDKLPHHRDGHRLQRVKVSSKTIEDALDIYADDPVVALTVLTPNVLERWQEILKSFSDGRFQAVYTSGQLHLLIRNDNLFEPDLGSGAIASDGGRTFRRMLSETALICDFVLALKSRDWTQNRVGLGFSESKNHIASELTSIKRKKRSKILVAAPLIFTVAIMLFSAG